MQINHLSGEMLNLAYKEYNIKKLSKRNAYLSRLIGGFRIYKGQYFLFVLQLLSYIIIVGWIWWFFDLFTVGSYVDKQNELIDIDLYLKYSQGQKENQKRNTKRTADQ